MNGNISDHAAQLNLAVAWIWILLGFASGFVLGLFFHREDWLGGYGSFQRRLYRLAHVAFFGTGFVNFMFWLTVPRLGAGGTALVVASWAFIVGAITMPLCCVLMARSKKCKLLFGVPVFSLILGAAATLWKVFINFQPGNMTADQLQAGFLRLVKELYSTEETLRRRRQFKQRLRDSPNFGRAAHGKKRPELDLAA